MTRFLYLQGNAQAVRFKPFTAAANARMEKGLRRKLISLSCRLSPGWEESYQRVPSLIRGKNRV